MTQKVVRAVDALGFGRAFNACATGIAVVTARTSGGVPHGAAATAFSPVSLDPPLAQVTLSRTSRAASYLADAMFAINILSFEQKDVAGHFADGMLGEEPEWLLYGDVPVLAKNAATLECLPWNIYDGGDHVIVIGEVTAMEITAREPLVFLGGRFRRIDDPPVDTPRGDGGDDPVVGYFAGSRSFRPLSAPHPR